MYPSDGLRTLTAGEILKGIIMFNFDGMKPVDLSPRIKARAYLVDGTIQEGNLDPNGKPWVMVEGRYLGDNSLFKSFSEGFKGYSIWIEYIGKVKN